MRPGDRSDFVSEKQTSVRHVCALQARCLAVGQTLMGSYLIPATVDVPLDLAVNPWGIQERSRKFVWNDGDNRRKLITLTNKSDRHRSKRHLAPGGGIHEGASWSDGNGRPASPQAPGQSPVLASMAFLLEPLRTLFMKRRLSDSLLMAMQML